jgi:hypothetical protein
MKAAWSNWLSCSSASISTDAGGRTTNTAMPCRRHVATCSKKPSRISGDTRWLMYSWRARTGAKSGRAGTIQPSNEPSSRYTWCQPRSVRPRSTSRNSHLGIGRTKSSSCHAWRSLSSVNHGFRAAR